MKKFIEKIGMDKIAHFGVGGLVTALLTIALIAQDMDIFVVEPWRMLLYPIIGTVITAFVSVFKEVAVDYEKDWKDLYAALIGSATVFIATLVGFLLFVAN